MDLGEQKLEMINSILWNNSNTRTKVDVVEDIIENKIEKENKEREGNMRKIEVYEQEHIEDWCCCESNVCDAKQPRTWIIEDGNVESSTIECSWMSISACDFSRGVKLALLLVLVYD